MIQTSFIFSSADGRTCTILTKDAFHCIITEARRMYPLETGGILLGYYNQTFRVATIVTATSPPTDSEHGKSSFLRGVAGVGQILEEAKLWSPPAFYIGEWHTHPDARPSASWEDQRNMKRSAKRKLYNATSPMLLIVGGTANSPNMGLSIYRNKGSFIPLSLIYY